jgi:hypothetical protein
MARGTGRCGANRVIHAKWSPPTDTPQAFNLQSTHASYL